MLSVRKLLTVVTETTGTDAPGTTVEAELATVNLLTVSPSQSGATAVPLLSVAIRDMTWEPLLSCELSNENVKP